MLRKTIYATLIAILMMGAASAQGGRRTYRDCQDILMPCALTKKRKTTKILIARTNRRLRGVWMQKKI